MSARARSRRPWQALVVEPLVSPHELTAAGDRGLDGYLLICDFGEHVGPKGLIKIANRRYLSERVSRLYSHLALFLVAKGNEAMQDAERAWWDRRYPSTRVPGAT